MGVIMTQWGALLSFIFLKIIPFLLSRVTYFFSFERPPHLLGFSFSEERLGGANCRFAIAGLEVSLNSAFKGHTAFLEITMIHTRYLGMDWLKKEVRATTSPPNSLFLPFKK